MKRIQKGLGLFLSLALFLSVLSPCIPAKATDPGTFKVVVYPNVIKQPCLFQFTVPLSQDLKGGDWFKIIFPPGYKLPDPGYQYRENDIDLSLQDILLRDLTVNLVQSKACIEKVVLNYKEMSATFILSKSSRFVFLKTHPLLLSFGTSYFSTQSFSPITIQHKSIVPILPGTYTFQFVTNHDQIGIRSNPVEVLPETGLIQDLQVSPLPFEFGRLASYKISFTTGPNHRMIANETWLYFNLVNGVQHFTLGSSNTYMSSSLPSYMARFILINGTPVNRISNNYLVLLQSPVDVGPGEKVDIVFLKEFGLQNPKEPGVYTITGSQWSGYPYDPVDSKPYIIQPGRPIVFIKQAFSLLLHLEEDIPWREPFYVLLPDIVDSVSNNQKSVVLNGVNALTFQKTDQVLTITSNQHYKAGSILQIDFYYFHWKEPITDFTMSYKLKEEDPWIKSEPLSENQYSEKNITTLNRCYADKPCRIEQGLYFTDNSSLYSDDTINVQYPPDMQLPEQINPDTVQLLSEYYQIKSITIEGQTLKVKVLSYDNWENKSSARLIISSEANIRYPKRGNRWIDIKINTSRNPNYYTIVAFVDPVPAESKVQSSQSVEGQKSWLTAPPELSFQLSQPDRPLQVNNHILFPPLSPIQLPSGQYSLDLTYHTWEEMVEKVPHKIVYQIDTIKPVLTITNPHQTAALSRSEHYLITGKIELQPTLWNVGWEEIVQNTIDQEIKINHQTVFFEPTDGTFQAELTLKKGINPALIEVEDWAGNRIEKKIQLLYQYGILLTIGSKIMVSGDRQIQMDIAPMLKDGRTFIPIRYLGEAMGIGFETKTNTKKDVVSVTLSWSTHKIVINLQTKETTMDGKKVVMDAFPFILKGRLMVPLRFVSEQMGKAVTWDPIDQTILII